MADQTARLEAATVRAEVGSGILYRFSNDAQSEADIPTVSGNIPNLKKLILTIQQDGADKISFATKIYTSAADGLAATVDQEIFLVQASGDQEIYSVWQNVNGTAVDTGKRSLSASAVIEATQAARQAADSANTAANNALERTAPFLSPGLSDPTVRDNGDALQVGDTYFNTSLMANKTYSLDGWILSSVTGAQLTAAINTREPTIDAGAAGTYWDGSKTFKPLNKAAVGLNSVNNIPDLQKPVSQAQQAALDLKANLDSPTFTGTVSGITKTMVGLSNVNNTSDANKPISSATQTALDDKEPKITAGTNDQFWRGDKTFQSVTKANVGLGNVDNTSDAAKPVSNAQQSALNGKQGLAANLTALSGLSGVADVLAYFTAAGTMALTSLTSQARTFLAATTLVAQRAALGLGTAATKNSRAIDAEIVNIATYDDGYATGYSTPGANINGNGNGFNYYQYNIANDAAVQQAGVNGATSSKVSGINLLMNFGGPTARGGRHAVQAKLLQGFGGAGVTDQNNQDRFYVGLQGQVLSDCGDGGTSPSDLRGAYFGSAAYVGLYGTAKYVANITAAEFNTDIAAGTGASAGVRVAIHTGVQVASLIGERGYALDACFSGACLGGSNFGWKYGVAFHGLNGGPAFGADSTVLKVFPGASANATIDTVIDVTGVTCSAIIRSNSVSLTDAGMNLNRAGVFFNMGGATASVVTHTARTSGTASTYDAKWSYSGGSATNGMGVVQLEANGMITPLMRPAVDNSYSLGLSNFRYSVVYAGTGTINTSDAREKTKIAALSNAEISAAKQLGKEIGTYKWLAAIQEKGADARTHIGMTVQRAIEIMEGNGLVAAEYGFICRDEWEAEDEVGHEDEEGNYVLVRPAIEAGDKYGFRMDELLAFIAAGFEARLSALEEK